VPRIGARLNGPTQLAGNGAENKSSFRGRRFGGGFTSKQAGKPFRACGAGESRRRTTLIHLEIAPCNPALPFGIPIVPCNANRVDISAYDSPEDIASGVRAIVDTLGSQLPETKILVMGILPRGETADNPLRQEVEAANALISKFADGKTVFYMDIGSSLLGADGEFLPGVVFPDYTHLTKSGYEIWASAIEPTIKAIVG